ncbi:MAG: ATP-binding protein, partial [Rubrobacteraceae bacterium]
RAGRLPEKGAGGSGKSGGPSNLPAPLTSFVGRENETLEVKRLLSMTRLLTLTGAGGCGKTRLAVETARGLVGAYPDGVWLVELAPLSEGTSQAVAAALDVHEQPNLPLADTLSDHLRRKDLLLVLDNCEHLVDSAARLADTLLGACPKLKILATSRERLGVPGEAVWAVPPLSLPGEDGAPEGLMRCEAVRLFVDRARSRLPAFDLTENNARSVAEVCRKLDGIPLAIELATARMGALAVEQVAERLEDSLGLLTGGGRTTEPRHQTMRATLEWSHGLLDEPEQKLFHRLSVFAGGFSLEAAEEACSGEGIERDDILDLLSRLVDKSLVIAGAGGGAAPRYRTLEPIRQYALERLEESGEKERVRNRHASYYLALAEAAEPELVGAGQIAWLERLGTEYANLRAALGWFLDEEGVEREERARAGLRLAAALGRFWGIRAAIEGREWIEKGLAKSGAAPASLWAKALREAGFMAVYHLDERAIEMLQEALALYEELGDEVGRATAINYLTHGVGILGRHELIPTLREEARALLAKSPEDRRTVAYLQLTLGMMAMLEDPTQVVTRIEKALSLFREVGDVRTCAMCHTVMGIAALGRGDGEGAAREFEGALRLLRRLKDKMGILYSL